MIIFRKKNISLLLVYHLEHHLNWRISWWACWGAKQPTVWISTTSLVTHFSRVSEKVQAQVPCLPNCRRRREQWRFRSRKERRLSTDRSLKRRKLLALVPRMTSFLCRATLVVILIIIRQSSKCTIKWWSETNEYKKE